MQLLRLLADKWWYKHECICTCGPAHPKLYFDPIRNQCSSLADDYKCVFIKVFRAVIEDFYIITYMYVYIFKRTKNLLLLAFLGQQLKKQKR